LGWRNERFEIIYDEEVIFGPRAKHDWQKLRQFRLLSTNHRFIKRVPVPMFKSDDEFQPLQAADMYAWCLRNATDKQDHVEFAWLLEELQNVKPTIYSQYYDLPRMLSVMESSQEIARRGDVEPELLAVHRDTMETYGRRKRKTP
jgi:hypothetical protein